MERLLSGVELAKELGVSRWTIRNWRIDRGMPSTRVGTIYYYRRSEVEGWLSKNKEEQK